MPNFVFMKLIFLYQLDIQTSQQIGVFLKLGLAVVRFEIAASLIITLTKSCRHICMGFHDVSN